MIRNSKFEIQNQELNTILPAVTNHYKRAIILFIGEKGKAKGGHETFSRPICEEYPHFKLKPYSIPPKLTVLKNTDHLIEQDSDNYWVLTDLGRKAYKLLKIYFKS